jgi:hypothetical protein
MPEALRNGVECVYAQTKKPILVSENGIDTGNNLQRIWSQRAPQRNLIDPLP